MHSRSASIKIILKIWAAALLMNTLIGTAVLTDLYAYADTVGLVALLGFIYATVFTLPFIALLCVSLRSLVRMDFSGKKLFGFFFTAGLLLTMASFTLFFLMAGMGILPVWSLLIVAICSSALAMLLEYRPVIQLRKDEVEAEYNRFLE